MPPTTIAHLKDHVGQEVTLNGWLYHRRSKGKIHFLLVRDGTGLVQGVMGRADVPEEVFALCDTLPQESSLTVTGTVREDARAPGGVELSIKGVTVHQAAAPYPIAIQDDTPGVDFLMERRHLWLRSRRPHAILRVRSEVEKALRDFFDEREFTLVDAPIFTPAACEGTTTLFETEYFDDKAYLTQSGQLYMEAAAMAFGKVYCLGPTFRAERSKTRRHLTEFWMLEPEMAYATLEDVMQLAEEMLVYVVGRALRKRAEELKTLGRDVSKLETVKAPFPRMSYDEAVALMNREGHAFQWGGDFGAPDETFLASRHDRPLMVHRYPAAVKAFYMKPDPENPKLALGVDVLAPEGYGEIIGGGERSTDLAMLERKIEEHKLPKAAFEWYLDLRRHGNVPHGGFGLGIERLTAWITGTEHVRECIPFPRTIYRIYP
jgi:asparaginyl-tRNA synthetase